MAEAEQEKSVSATARVKLFLEQFSLLTLLFSGVREWVSGLGLFMFICLALMCAARLRAQLAKRGLLFSVWFLRFPAFALRLCAVSVC